MGARGFLAVAGALLAAAPVHAQGAGPVHVFLDASQSMAGFVRPQFDARPIGDLVLLMQGGAGGEPRFWCFGKGVAPLARPEAFGTPAAYAGRGAPGCGNLESRIDLALGAARSKTDNALSVIVTDLWLENSSYAGTPAVALGEPLRAMLARGRTVAVVGVRSRFEGPVFGVPGVGTYRGAKERPLFLVMIGPRARVAALVARLRESGSPSFRPGAMQVALFTGAEPPLPAPTPVPLGGGVTRTQAVRPGVAAFAMNRTLAAKPAQRGRIEGVYEAGAGLPPGTVWAGRPATRVKLWRRQGKSWVPLAIPVPAWTAVGPTAARFSLSAPATARLPGRSTYWIVGEIGTRGLQSPNPAAAWMRQWSLKPGRPGTFVGALELGTLAGILENAAQQAGPAFRATRGFQFTVRIDE